MSDALSLPPVPPPAPDDHPLRDRMIAALFAIAIAWPAVALVFTWSRTLTRFENRPMAPWPAPAFVARVRRRLSSARSPIASAAATRSCGCITRALLALFGVSSLPNVMRADDGWFYWLGEDGHSLDRHYRRHDAVSAERSRQHRRRVRAPQGVARCARHRLRRGGGAREVHDLSRAPARLDRAGRRSPRPTIACATRSQKDGRVALRRPAARAAGREGARARLLPDRFALELQRRDGRLRDDDAARCSEALRGKLADDRARAAVPPYTPGVDFYSGDLIQMLGLPARIREDDVAPLGKVLADAREPLRAAHRQGRVPGLRVLRVRPAGPAARGGAARLDGDPADPAAVGEFQPRGVRQQSRARPRADRAREARHRHRGAGRAHPARARRIPDDRASDAARPLPARAPLRSSGSSPSSWILRVSVLRPQPSHAAASMRWPPVCASARRISVFSNSCSRRSPTLRSPRASACASSRSSACCQSESPPSPRRRRRLAHFRRQVGDLDPLPRRHHGEPVADVLELAHVAGKRELREHLERLLGQHLRLDREVARALLQEVARERRDVLGALAQRRQAQPHDVEPVHQVLAEQALPHALLEVLVRRRDDAHVRAQAARGRRRGSTRRRRARAAGAPAGRPACRRSRPGTACRLPPARSARAAAPARR